MANTEKPKEKPVLFLHGEIKTPPFSLAARTDAGVLLGKLQNGVSLGMPHSRPMPSIGKGCHELRVRDENLNWRIVYRIDPDVIMVVEVFEKKTQATPKQVIDRCKARLSKYDKFKTNEGEHGQGKA